MIYKYDNLWSYLSNEPSEVIEKAKGLLTRRDYDFEEEKWNTTKLWISHSNILGIETIKFPTGLCYFLAKELNVGIEYKKKRYPEYNKEDILAVAEKVKDVFHNFQVRDYQMDLVSASLDKYSSLIVSSTGSGKTSVMTLVALLLKDQRILVINNQNFILRQIYERFLAMGIKEDDIGTGTTDLSKRIVIISSQTSYNRIKEGNEEYLNYLKTVDTIICDECAHFQSISHFALLFYTTNLKHLIGYTATPYKNPTDPYNNTDDLVTIGFFGEPAAEYTMNDSISNNNIAQPYSYYINYKNYPIECPPNTDFFLMYKKCIVHNKARNYAGVELIKYLNQKNIKTLVLFREVKRHGLPIMKQLRQIGVPALFLQGGDKIHEYDKNLKLHSKKGNVDDIKEALQNGYNIVLASQVMDEGVDITSFQAGVLFTGGKSPIKIIQQTGRVSRAKSNGENIALIVDFNDSGVNSMFSRQYQERRKTLKNNGVIELDDVQKLFSLVERMKQ